MTGSKSHRNNQRERHCLFVFLTINFYLVNVDGPSGLLTGPIFPTMRMEHSMLTCSCRRSHHSLSQTISCGGWGEKEQTKRTCEIYTPGKGWSKENFLLANSTVEHVGWKTQPTYMNDTPALDQFPDGIVLILSGRSEGILVPKGSFKKEQKSWNILSFFQKLLTKIFLFIKVL